MKFARFEAVAAEIAALPPDAVKIACGRVIRAMAARRTGREVVAYLIVLGHVLTGRGEAVVHVDRLADDAGLTRRAFSAALAVLEHEGLVMVERVGKDARRMTLPSLLSVVSSRSGNRPQIVEPYRTLH